jgi:hypothetical protein
MVFRRRDKLNGELDPNININGRIDGKKAEPLTNRKIREREFLSLLRKLKPHVAESINTAIKIMGCEKATDVNKLKAATIILAEYKSAITETYNKDYDEAEGVEPQPTTKAPVFSLTMVKNGEEISKVE